MKTIGTGKSEAEIAEVAGHYMDALEKYRVALLAGIFETPTTRELVA
jgi:hypothetical protein